MRRNILLTSLAAVALFALPLSLRAEEKKGTEPLTLLVMDPLAAELSCPCVEGYAQRKYSDLAKHLEKQLGRPVKLAFSETIGDALKKKTDGKADLLIGKDSVIRAQSKPNGINLVHIAALSGKDGKTTQTGLIVVAGKDAAVTVDDLKGYTVFFGAAECDEKCSAALALLKETKVQYIKADEACASCSVAATKVLDLFKQEQKAAGVISSYAAPLLEGCGTIKKGDLRVIGVTEEVPFISAFVNEKLSSKDREAIVKALLAVGKDAALCKAMETKNGFVEAKKK